MESDRSTIEPGTGRTEPPSTPGRARRIIGRVVPALLTAGALVHPLATLLGRWSWRADLFAHFQVPGLAVTLAALVASARRHRRLAVALAVLAVLQAFPLFRYAGTNPVPPDPRSTARLRILMANVLVDNTDHDALARLIRREHPDIVGLVEFTTAWRDGLAEVREDFPCRVEAPAWAGGLALWFRTRPARTNPPEWPLDEGWPCLHAEVEFAGQVRHLWLVHPRPPMIRFGSPELAALADRVRSTGGSRIVVGDLNSSEGSPLFADFLRDSGLRDTRLGFGRQPSWPTDLPFLRIAIDQAFVSEDLAVADRRLGPAIGSDHFPIILDLAPAAGASPARSASSNSSSPSK